VNAFPLVSLPEENFTRGRRKSGDKGGSIADI